LLRHQTPIEIPYFAHAEKHPYSLGAAEPDMSAIKLPMAILLRRLTNALERIDQAPHPGVAPPLMYAHRIARLPQFGGILKLVAWSPLDAAAPGRPR